MTDHEPDDEATISEGEAERRADETAELESLLPDAKAEEVDDKESAEAKEQLRTLAESLRESCGEMAEVAKGYAGDTRIIGEIQEMYDKVQGLNYQLGELDQTSQEAIMYLAGALNRYADNLASLQQQLGSRVGPLEQGSADLDRELDGLVSSPDAVAAQTSVDGINTMMRDCTEAVNSADYEILDSERGLRQAANSAFEQIPYSHPIRPQVELIVQEELNVILRRSATNREERGQDLVSHTSRSRDILDQMALLRS